MVGQDAGMSDGIVNDYSDVCPNPRFPAKRERLEILRTCT